MTRSNQIACLALLLAACSPDYGKPVTNPIQYALPTMGSGGYAYAYGSAWPGAEVPNGMMRAGPDTSGLYGNISFLHFSGYWSGDNTVLEFTHLHLHGTGATDYGVLGILPVPAFNPSELRVTDYASTFAKTSENATPGYYAVTLDNGPILAELTATTHASHERFTFPSTASSGTVLIDLTPHLGGTVSNADITLGPSNTVTGELQTAGGMSGGFELYFAMQFNKAWTTPHVWSDAAAPSNASTASGTGVGTALDFDVSDGQPVEVQVALSLVSAAGAAANLAAEMPAWNFDGTRTAATSAWNTRLGALQVYGGTEQQLQTFYSSLHHAFVMPGQYGDVDGSFLYDGTTSMAQGFHFMNDFSGWDIYRTLHPLYVLVAPDVALDDVQSLYAMAQISTNFPKWPLAASDSGVMIGSAADVILSDAYVKGVTGYDAMDAYKRLRDAALLADLPSGEGRGGRDYFQDYSTYGYALAGDGNAVSMTCELNQDDFALSNFATALGQTQDAQTLLQRSSGWQHLYDPTTGFLRTHFADGGIPNDDFEANEFGLSGEYQEADAYQSEFCPQWDAAGLATVWGGNAQFTSALSMLFQNSQQEYASDVEQMKTMPLIDPNLLDINLPATYYFAGNEPDIHYAYLFARAGRPDLTQQWVAWLRSTFYSALPNGLPGNDDGGTMAAWYVFSALGIYPTPGSDEYIVGTPMFRRVDIKVAKGVFSIIANDVSEENIYVQSAQLNGASLNTPIIHHSDIKASGSLVLQMGPKPSQWGRTGS